MSNFLPIEIQRNADFLVGLNFKDRNTGEPLDISGWDFTLQVKYVGGIAATAITSGAFSDQIGPSGTVNLLIRGSNFSSVPGSQERVTLAYDLLAKDADGYVVCQMRGPVHLLPGVSVA
ncbi:hypothetical protein CP98_03649 [Sphingobium yanoikuyae]|uniref:Uncharacterized protein n=1 Tax=Sphingobium yanoikuyae TaxID=13690 RepID=A0A084EGQ9_SPHYA|nr:hypothetical protein [Sphingobium yanoikuyae]KEZ17151.1 hypothetical protein CP98_03649 [Sphingobium yanoikuyae]